MTGIRIGGPITITMKGSVFVRSRCQDSGILLGWTRSSDSLLLGKGTDRGTVHLAKSQYL